ncbi:MAG: glutathione S-transferase family protein [Pseudomonadota bacterium]
MRYRLHNRLGSGGFAVQATLAAAGIDFAYDPIASRPNEPLGPQIQDLNTWGQVPVLELESGARITEVAAILAHLADVEPALRSGPALWIDDHPLFLRWAVFLSVNAYEGVLRQSYTSRYFECELGPELPADTKDLIAGSIRQAASARVHEAFKTIERETAQHAFLLSDRLSPCDIYLAMLYAWHNRRPDLPKCTWITTQVATHPGIREIWKQNFHDRLDFKWHEL